MSATTARPDKVRLKAEAKFSVTNQGDAQVRQSAEETHRLVLEKIAELRALRLAKAGRRWPDDAEKSFVRPAQRNTEEKGAHKDRR